MTKKIRCPFWNDCFIDDIEPAALFGHLSSEHTLGEIKHAYWELVVKINKELERHKQENVCGPSVFVTKDGVEWQSEKYYYVVKILDSILRDDLV